MLDRVELSCALPTVPPPLPVYGPRFLDDALQVETDNTNLIDIATRVMVSFGHTMGKVFVQNPVPHFVHTGALELPQVAAADLLGGHGIFVCNGTALTDGSALPPCEICLCNGTALTDGSASPPGGIFVCNGTALTEWSASPPGGIFVCNGTALTDGSASPPGGIFVCNGAALTDGSASPPGELFVCNG